MSRNAQCGSDELSRVERSGAKQAQRSTAQSCGVVLSEASKGRSRFAGIGTLKGASS